MRGEDQLEKELHDFQQDKERISSIVGQIGGRSNQKYNDIVNGVLLFTIFALLFFGGVLGRLDIQTTMELGILIGILKILWMFYDARKVSHFQFWILNSLEVRMNEIHKKVKIIDKRMERLEENQKEFNSLKEESKSFEEDLYSIEK